jgi:hypothetical protein
MYKMEISIQTTCIWSSSIRVAFSPDSSMFVIPEEKNVVDNNGTGRKLIGFESGPQKPEK